MARVPFYRREPKWQIVLAEVFFLLLYAFFTDRLGGMDPNRLIIGIDFTVFLFGLAFWPFFFAQFVLPVKSPWERIKSFALLVFYLLGYHGPAQRIENGRTVERTDEKKRRGPGVLLLDAASAAVLRTHVTFTRTVGPGIVFTRYDPGRGSTERVAGAVDLRPQTRTIGPAENENPFQPCGRDESDESFRRRQEHRLETSALTRDGIEVVPNISVTFRLDSAPNPNGGYPFNPVSVFRAVVGEGVDPSVSVDDARRSVSWEWLPTRLAADIWRETLRMFTLDELFEVSFQDRTAREMIVDSMRQRLTQAKMVELNDVGRPTGRMAISPEFALLIQRGLRITSVNISNLRLLPTVDEELTRRWESSWLQRARQERELLDVQRAYAQETGQRKALCEFAQAASQFVDPQDPDQEKDGLELLKLLAEGTLMLAVRDPQLHLRISAEKNELVDLIGWTQQRP